MVIRLCAGIVVFIILSRIKLIKCPCERADNSASGTLRLAYQAEKSLHEKCIKPHSDNAEFPYTTNKPIKL